MTPRAQWFVGGAGCVLLVLLVTSTPARAAPSATPSGPGAAPAPSEPTLVEPTLVELQRGAVEAARIDPERVRSLERRLRASSLLPQLRVRVGRGTGQLLTTTDYDGNTRLSVGDRDAWQVDVSASWSLDRLLFHPDELRLAREAERLASHREHVLREVAELYIERHKLLRAVALARGRPAQSPELALRLEAVTALLEALTGRELPAAIP